MANFSVLDSRNVAIKSYKSYSGAINWIKQQVDAESFSIIECGEGYWSDRVVKQWRAQIRNNYLYFKRSSIE